MPVDVDAIHAVCPYCGNEGESYNDGENFEKEYYNAINERLTICKACKCGF